MNISEYEIITLVAIGLLVDWNLSFLCPSTCFAKAVCVAQEMCLLTSASPWCRQETIAAHCTEE